MFEQRWTTRSALDDCCARGRHTAHVSRSSMRSRAARSSGHCRCFGSPGRYPTIPAHRRGTATSPSRTSALRSAASCFARARSCWSGAPPTECRWRFVQLPTLYEARGEFQLTVEFMRRAGLGALFERFARLKARLEAEGLFAAERKRALPRFPARIGRGHVARGRGSARRADHVAAPDARRSRSCCTRRRCKARAQPRRSPRCSRMAGEPQRVRRADPVSRRRQHRGSVVLQRRSRCARDRGLSHSGRLRCRPRDRLHHRRLRGRRSGSRRQRARRRS